MVNKMIGVILFSAVVLTQAYCSPQKAGTTRQVESADLRAHPKSSTSSNIALDEHRIQYLITLLSSDNEDERNNAQTELINLAGESSQNRKAIIDKLILSVEQFDLENKLVLEPKTFRFWLSATQIFSSLQATEAIDLLIRYIYCSDGVVGIGPYDRPAESALMIMGSSAVPKLSEALLHNDNPIIKKSVALCLGDIGGPEAKQALERAIQWETNRDVVHSIKMALSTIARESP